MPALEHALELELELTLIYIYTISILAATILFFLMPPVGSQSENIDVSSQTVVMEQEVKALARGIRDAMMMLSDYSLTNAPESHMEAIQRIRDVLEADLEGYTNLFQRCRGFTEETISMYDDLANRGVSEAQPLLKHLAGNLGGLVNKLTTTLGEARNNLKRHVTLLQAGTALDELGLLLQAVDGTLKPLQKLGVFFKGQVDHPPPASPTEQDMKESVEAWKRSLDVLRQASGSISVTQDAAKVNFNRSAFTSLGNREGSGN